MAASIVLTGFSANDPVPGTFLEILHAQGGSAGYQGAYPAILLGNKTSAGSATVDTAIYGPDTAVPCQTESDVINLFGAGSELHRGWLKFTEVNTTTSVYMLAVTESAGTAASITLTIGGPATSDGNLRVWVGTEFVDTGFTNGQANTAVATAVAASINTKTRWAVTASPSTNTVVITAKQKGPRGNEIKVQTLVTSGTGITSTASTITALSSGATADSNTAALATIASRFFYWQVSAASDATQLGALVSQTNSNAGAIIGIRERVIAGSTDTISNTVTVTTGRNAARGEMVWQPSSEYTGFELACNNAALYALLVTESLPKPRHNFSNFPARDADQALWKISAPRSGVGPTRADIVTALNNGITPIQALSSGRSQLVRRVTMKSLTGSTADYRVRDAHKVDVCDLFGNDAVAVTNQQYGGLDIADDPPTGATPPQGAVFPRLWKGTLFALLDRYAANGQLQRVEEIKARTNVQREVIPADRMSAQIPLQPVDIANAFAIQVLQVA